MEILRVPPYEHVNITFTVPSGYTTATTFTAVITDMADLSSSTSEHSKVTGETIVFALPGRYDNDYHIIVMDEDNIPVLDQTYEIVRPYVDATTKATLPSEIAKYAKNEELARAIIDSVIPEGFYYKRKVIETTGQNVDYIPVWDNVTKVLEVYENNELVTDYSFELSKDKTAIIQTYTGKLNRDEVAPLILPLAMSDSVDFPYPVVSGFPRGYDYRFVVEYGYYGVPSDIVRATELLVEDIECGRLDYYKRYISDYNTDQFKMKFDSRVFEGTGNVLVDKILSKYAKSIKFLGVL